VVKNKLHEKKKHGRERALHRNLHDWTYKKNTTQRTASKEDKVVVIKYPPRRDGNGGEASSKQHDGKASARANAAQHPRAGGITRTAEPK
jgi:hypothetical protein